MKKNKKKKETGGVALENGIDFMTTNKKVVVQRKNSRIECNVHMGEERKPFYLYIPILRWIIGLKNQLIEGAGDYAESIGDEVENSGLATIVVGVILLSFCTAIPMFSSLLIPIKFRSVYQAIIYILEFLAYIILITSDKERQTLFEYHGAEHKAVNAYLNLDIKDITIENIKKQSRFNKKCGGNLITYYFILMAMCTFIPITNIWIKALTMFILAILNIGVAGEIIQFMGILPKPLDIIAYPGAFIQLFTTKEPSIDKIELARYGILAAVRDEDISVNEYMEYITKKLDGEGIEYNIDDIYLIISIVKRMTLAQILANKNDKIINIHHEINIDEALRQYFVIKRPIAYIFGFKYFYKEKYAVNEHVLIPRSDTEVLVENAIRYIDNEGIKNVVDLCTGTGAIGISVAKNTKEPINLWLLDISKDAINIAKKNVASNNLITPCKVDLSNLLQTIISKIKEQEKVNLELPEEEKIDLRQDMILSNPPYIETNVLDALDDYVKKEPKLALDGGTDGMYFYKRIFEESKEVLKDNGILMLEIGYDQLEKIKSLIDKNPEYTLLESIKDYGGNDRVVICRFHQI